jgi:hypothetical protein
VDVDLVDQHDVLGRAVVAGEQLDVVLLDADGLVDDAGVGAGDPLAEEGVHSVSENRMPLSVRAAAQVGDEVGSR